MAGPCCAPPARPPARRLPACLSLDSELATVPVPSIDRGCGAVRSVANSWGSATKLTNSLSQSLRSAGVQSRCRVTGLAGRSHGGVGQGPGWHLQLLLERIHRRDRLEAAGSSSGGARFTCSGRSKASYGLLAPMDTCSFDCCCYRAEPWRSCTNIRCILIERARCCRG